MNALTAIVLYISLLAFKSILNPSIDPKISMPKAPPSQLCRCHRCPGSILFTRSNHVNCTHICVKLLININNFKIFLMLAFIVRIELDLKS